MKRKTALKNMLLATGGTLILPSWAFNWSKEKLPSFDSVFTKYQEQQINSLVDTILPYNGILGGLSVDVDIFLIGLLSECYDEPFQKHIKEMLVNLDQKSQSRFSKEYSSASQNERELILLDLQQGTKQEKDFFEFFKNEIIRGFETSEEVLVNYRGYVLMPGFYDGDVTIGEN